MTNPLALLSPGRTIRRSTSLARPSEPSERLAELVSKCFATATIVRRIAMHVYNSGDGKGSVLAFALTCHATQDIALQHLWANMESLEPLSEILYDPTRYSTISGGAQHPDDRFSYYAHMIKQTIFTHFFMMAPQWVAPREGCPRAHKDMLLPNLEVLSWLDDSFDSETCLRLISSKLKSLHIIHYYWNDDHVYYAALSEIIYHIAAHRIPLNSFTLEVREDNRADAMRAIARVANKRQESTPGRCFDYNLDTALSYLAESINLFEFASPCCLTDSALAHLARMPTLNILRFLCRGDMKPIQSSGRGFNFPNLRILDLTIESLTEDIVDFFTSIQGPSILRLDITIISADPPKSLMHRLLSAMCKAPYHDTLKYLSLTVKGHKELEPPIEREAFAPLFASPFPNLINLFLAFPSMDPTDQFLRDLATAYPKLEVLSLLRPGSAPRLIVPSATLEGAHALAVSCRSLNTLALAFNTGPHLGLQARWKAAECSNLRSWCVLGSDIKDSAVEDLARYLAFVFPNLEKLWTKMPTRDDSDRLLFSRWGDVDFDAWCRRRSGMIALKRAIRTPLQAVLRR